MAELDQVSNAIAAPGQLDSLEEDELMQAFNELVVTEPESIAATPVTISAASSTSTQSQVEIKSDKVAKTPTNLKTPSTSNKTVGAVSATTKGTVSSAIKPNVNSSKKLATVSSATPTSSGKAQEATKVRAVA